MTDLNETQEKELFNVNFQYGRWLSSPPAGEEVVISGMSGRFPESDNVYEFRDNLFNKTEMVTENEKRWKLDHPDVPKRSANINNINKLDAGYFGLHYRQAKNLDPSLKVLMETVIEAIMDAGVNPLELKGSKTGVFIGFCYSDVENMTLVEMTKSQQFCVTGFLKSLLAHRLSYYLRLKGPSFIVDTACSSSGNALHSAFKSMRSGECENAIVASCNLTIHPGVTIQFSRLGVLSPEGIPRVFDQDANGYVRSEACTCFLLQKSKNAKRIYAQIINTKVNTDGFKKEGITFPSSRVQEELMTEIYRESSIEFSELSYVEAHGTGTQAGDPEEANAIDRALAKNCGKELLVGSVKSNIGHTEPVSGLCSIVKVLIAMETGLIPPNINLRRVRKGLEGIEQNRMKIVTETTELLEHDAVVGVNNFGFGGNNCHMILQRFKKRKINGGLPKDDVPRLICVSGRTNEAVLKILNDVSNKSLDEEHVGLLHQLYKTNTPNHFYRGYAIVSKRGVVSVSSKLMPSKKPHLHLFFGQFVNNFRILASYLKKFSIFEYFETSINQILVRNNVKTLKELLDAKTKVNEDALGSICVQLILVDIIKDLECFPTCVFGNKIATAYYNNIVQLEEAVSAAIEFSQMNSDANLNFQTLPDLADSKEKNQTKGDYLTCQNFIKSSKGAVILNISDLPLNGEDNLLVQNGDVNLLDLLGRLYTQGYLPQVHKLYPQIKFPVSRGTSMVSPSVQWNHDKSWTTYKFSDFTSWDTEQRVHRISLLYEDHQFMSGHCIDGRNLLPATEYLHLVWQTYAQSRRLLSSDIPVVFEDCKFMRAVTLPKSGYVKLLITIQRGTGKFEILEKDSMIVSGRIHPCPNASEQQVNLPNFHSFSDNKLEILKQDDIYREFYLRGYNYSGLFKSIKRCNADASTGLIKWENNWSAFMDNMLQMKILQCDTRLLFVPIGIKKIIIDPLKHTDIVNEQDAKECLLPVYANKYCNFIKAGGIEIHGVQVKSIFKKKQRLEPVLEKNVFIPNNVSLGLEEAVRVNTQIILENSLETNFKAVEIINEFTDPNAEHILGFVNKTLEHIPLLTPDLTISSKTTVTETPGIKIENVTLTHESNILLYVGSKILQQLNTLKQSFVPLSKNGFILTREDISFSLENDIDEIDIVTEYVTPNERIFLMKKKVENYEPKFIEVSSSNVNWIPVLQKALNLGKDVITHATNRDPEGILGLINCIRRESNGNLVKCFFMMDDAPEFDPQHSFYSKQINKNLAMNIYKDKSWGTYRHLLLEERPKINCEHSYAYFKSRGDISSFEWLEGALCKEVPLKEEQLLVSTCYSSINFKDVMAASGRVNPEILQSHRLDQEFLIGFEFSGIDLSGHRIAGMTNTQGISSYVTFDSSLFWTIPDSWTLEDAATVPVVYSTVLYALLMVGDMKSGSSVLIHSATGGIGLAALNICLHYKCDIYVTVGTQEKRVYLKENYPQIPDDHIGNSRDISFEQMIKKQTRNKGIDLILNSLSEDKLQASIRCLAQEGKFLEIGKYDLANDSSLNLLLMEKEASYHGIFLDDVFRDIKEMKTKLVKRLVEGIGAGFVKPLPRIVFNADEIEKSYRYMMSGQHIGRILIKLRNEEQDNANKFQIMSNPRFNCDIRYTYVVIGGLGGVGLELTDWLILRGARKLVLSSRSGVQNGYHQQRINVWKTYGVEVTISTTDVTTEQGCEDLVREANALGPVDAIFNLAVVLKDALFQNQTQENFEASLAPKVHATLYLDRVTRKLCPKLRYFVVFSSVSCGRGNPGQSNYGMANSVMERICENRKRDGLPAVAIQWGAIGEVGLVAKLQKDNKELVIGGTLQQKISSCLEVLDVLLKHNYPVVSSMVVAEKHDRSGAFSAVEAVANVLGVKDMKTISQYTTFAELGMDSMMGTEINQILEKDFEIYVTPKEVMTLTFAKLTEMEADKMKKSGNIVDEKIEEGTNLLIQFIPSGENVELAAVTLNSQVDSGVEAPIVLVLPGVEGDFKPLEYLTSSLNAHVIGIQYSYNNPEGSIQETAQNTLPHIQNYLSRKKPIYIVGHSFGALVGLEIISLLEKKGHNIIMILIDGSPTYLTSSLKKHFAHETEAHLQTAILNKIASFFIPLDILAQHEDTLLKCKDLEERMDLLLASLPSETINKQKLEKQAAVALYMRCKAVLNYTFKNEKIKSSIHLFKAKLSMIDEEDDYQMSKICDNLAEVTTIDGDHATVLNSPDLVKAISEIVALKS
ncbi:hypothetical protein Zmor_018385 [Zophobas morio]|uniref:oleoyl-[acyl-carrier-protein] hydrolase n=1 Tax=Zophobas morio TaxID=2755281 RepID=A0AA38MDG9_9CUCU|nr:hypothetical protein Zmor_018385 [Zophobas morio]